ncbi:FAD-binding oxidoreductase [uncultured Jannaschia sp.]|uniref:NAD(P)/FAD-dependent oxidoreductase n=1 Tax=uncultured Jannaschia sp. TaxID=293347 RepID=UPI002617FFE5|nr:FAD-binding oxidoreductase [uncultured Jannaschia sp.]
MSWLHANGDGWPGTVYDEGLPPAPEHPPLRGRRTADLCVVGGGITGLSAAVAAARAGMFVVVLEAQRVGWGASGRNGGQIGRGFNWSQRRLEARLGERTARALWELSEEAVRLTRQALPPEAGHRSGILTAARSDGERTRIAADAEWMNERYGTGARVLDRDEIAAAIGTRAYAGGVLDQVGGTCNPLAYIRALARQATEAGAAIHERSEVHRIHGTEVATAQGAIAARFVLHATNGYSPHLTGPTAARVLPINSYIAATAPVPGAEGRDGFAVADDRFVVNYFRWTPEGRLIYGGGESYGRRFPRDIRAKVRANLARVYPELAEVELTHAWGGTLAVTATRLPYLAEAAPGVFAAGGYSGHGLALSGLAGRVAVEAMRGERARLDLLARLPVPALPGGRIFGPWAAQAGMVFGAVRDRL